MFQLRSSWHFCDHMWLKISKRKVSLPRNRVLCVLIHWLASGLSCKPNIYVSWYTSELRMRVALWTRFKLPSKMFLLAVPRRYFFCGSLVFLCIVFLMLLCLFIASLWPSAEKGLTSWLLLLMFIVFLLLSHVVSWVRCGTWLYRFLIFAPFLTFIQSVQV